VVKKRPKCSCAKIWTRRTNFHISGCIWNLDLAKAKAELINNQAGPWLGSLQRQSETYDFVPLYKLSNHTVISPA
jgi:hypothetical protein